MRPGRAGWRIGLLAAAAAFALPASGAPAPPAPPAAPAAQTAPHTPDQARLLAIRAAQADGLNRLAGMVLAARVSAVKTLGQALGPGSDREIALRVFLRPARMVSEPRVYSDGVAEVDLEVPLEAVLRKVNDLYTPGEHETAALEDLRYRAVDEYLRASGLGRAPRSVSAAILKGVESARPEDLPELFPAAWEHVTAMGRVEAIRRARVQAYEAMARRLRGILLGQTGKVEDLIGGVPAAESLFDVFVRSLAVGRPPRMMPDRIAEVEVVAAVRDVIQVLKDVRELRGPQARWTEDQIDRLSVRLKAESLSAIGRGMPPAEEVSAAETPVEGGSPLPDWAAQEFEAAGTARFSDDVTDPQEARVLAARSAKARAAANLAKQVDAVVLKEGLAVRQLAARDPVFGRDLTTFLSSAHTATYCATEDGQGWKVVLRLPLRRLYECYRARS